MPHREPVELTESAKRRLPEVERARRIRGARQAGSAVGQASRQIGTRRERNRAAGEAAAAALGIRRKNQTTDSNN